MNWPTDYINKVIQGDCIEVMKRIPDKSIDLILADPPYGTTACSWDSVIPFAPMWERLNKLIKPNGAIVLFGSEPFSSALRMSNIKHYKYDWVWNKNISANFMMAKYVPLKRTENILIFSLGGINQNTKNKMAYFPQGLLDINKKVNGKVKKEGMNIYNCLNKTFTQTKTNYPINILRFDSENSLHPTQKPVALGQYLIRTYTNEEETILDFTCGSGSFLVAALLEKRNFIGIEKDAGYVEIANKRISQEKPLF